MSFKIRRGTDAERLLITPLEGELIYATDTMKVYVGDGSTAGGVLVTGGGAGGGTGYNGSKGYDGSTGLAATIAVGSVNTGAPGSAVLVTNSGSSSAATFNFTIPSGFTGSRGAAGLQGGTLTSNLNTSTFNITNGSNLTINGNNGSINSTGILLSNGTLSSTNIFESPEGNDIGNIIIPDYNQISMSNSDGSIPFFNLAGITLGAASPYDNVLISKGTINSPTTLSTGDVLYTKYIRGFDGSDFVLSSVIQFRIDENLSVTTGSTPGKIIFGCFPDDNAPITTKVLTWGSQGRLAVNQFDATETIDVNGTGKFSGYVIFGSYSTTERDALTAVNGMVIYNTTDEKFQGRQAGAWVNFV